MCETKDPYCSTTHNKSSRHNNETLSHEQCTLFMNPLCQRNVAKDGVLRAQHWENITLICIDIVSFTEKTSVLSSLHVTKLLQEFYGRVDRSAVCHNVDKIDIIGDAYVAVSQNTNDAVLFCLAALAIAKSTYWDKQKPASGVLHLRCAVHAGKVTGLVLDSVPFKYTLVGEAMISAKQLETRAPPGSVHCSAAAAAYLDPQRFQKIGSLTAPDSYLIFQTPSMKNTTVMVETFFFESVSNHLISIFGFGAAELRTMRVLFGPDTRIDVIRMAMEQCLAFDHCTNIPVVLYTKAAVPTRIGLEISKADNLRGCVYVHCSLLPPAASNSQYEEGGPAPQPPFMKAASS